MAEAVDDDAARAPDLAIMREPLRELRIEVNVEPRVVLAETVDDECGVSRREPAVSRGPGYIDGAIFRQMAVGGDSC
ncbi:MAG: hypothetical protein JO307_21275 [Bryobacterales bacterium]|nr:hypothetical protein [Bryobacterales bacterium]MBV9397304.1 hypothetical protein [Bryobacterales bacterium]